MPASLEQQQTERDRIAVAEFMGEARAKLDVLERGQRDLWTAVTDGRAESTRQHEQLRGELAAVGTEFRADVEQIRADNARTREGLRDVRTRLALGAAVAAFVGSIIATVAVKHL